MMLKVTVLLLTVLAVNSADNSEKIKLQKCSNIKLIPNFDVNKSKGAWYVQKINKAAVVNIGDCSKYEPVGENIVMKSIRINGEYKSENLTIAEVGKTSMFILKMKSGENIPSWMVATDYDSYLIYYRCYGNTGMVTLATRKRNPDHKTMETAWRVMKESGLNTNNLTSVNQTGCTN